MFKKRTAAAAAKSLQSCPTLCDPIDGSPSGSTVRGILQARTLEWVAISFSNAWKGRVKVKSLSRVRLLATPWTAAYPAPPSMGFSRQEYWSGVPLPSPKRGHTNPKLRHSGWQLVEFSLSGTHWYIPWGTVTGSLPGETLEYCSKGQTYDAATCQEFLSKILMQETWKRSANARNI